MDTEAKILRHELEIAQENLKAATRKCRSLVYELENCTASYDAEKTLRDMQLSRILRALLVLEAQLKQEQKTIRRLLQEKDDIIQAQQLEIAKLSRVTKKYYKAKRDSQYEKLYKVELSGLQDKAVNSESDYDSYHSVSGIQKKFSFADSDTSKTSITSSEITDISNSSGTDKSSLLSGDECEGEEVGEAADCKIDRFVLKGTEDDKSEVKCNPGIRGKRSCVQVGAGEVVDSIRLDARNKTIGKDEIDEREGNCIVEPIYENVRVGELDKKEELANDVRDKTVNVTKRVLRPHPDQQAQEEANNQWYNDPDEDRANYDVFQNTIYQSNSNHNSVLECVNQILLRDMEEEENTRVTSRRYKYKGKIVCFQTAKLSDIESVGSEVERRNSEDMVETKTPTRSPEKLAVNKLETDLDTQLKVEAARIIHDESEKTEDILNDSEEAKALVIIEPKEEEEARYPQVETIITPEKRSLPPTPKRLSIAKNLDYEEIECLQSEVCEKTPQKPQFLKNTLILKKIPSPSFLIDESQKYTEKSPSVACKQLYEEIPSLKKSTNQMIFCQPLVQQFKDELKSHKNEEIKNNMGHFEEFKIESEGVAPRERHVDFPDIYDVQQNFEEFKLDECDLSDDLNRLEADGSDMQVSAANYGVALPSSTVENKNNQFNSCYDNFLEASGMSNKCILTPSRLISNHKSMLKPKDVKYKRKIKANGTIYEGQDTIIGVNSVYNTKHWTGPFV